MSTSEQLVRMQRLMALGNEQTRLMMRAMPGSVSAEVVESLEALLANLRDLADGARPGDILVTRPVVEERIADVTEWIARAHDSLNQSARASEYYRRAAELYRTLGQAQAAQRIEDKIGELRLHAEQDIDGETKRLIARLEDTEPGSIEQAKVLVALGELSTLGGDDFGAVKWLQKAEEILGGRPPDADALLTSLATSLQRIVSGDAGAGPSAIEEAMALRALHRRLFLALSNAYRDSDPDASASYAERAAALDKEQASRATRDALLAGLRSI